MVTKKCCTSLGLQNMYSIVKTITMRCILMYSKGWLGFIEEWGVVGDMYYYYLSCSLFVYLIFSNSSAISTGNYSFVLR